MKKTLTLSLLAVSALYSADVALEPINVEATVVTDVAQKAQTSADLAQALSDNVPAIDMSRRSAIANDILIRGQKRDNITVEVDGTKVYGACPNRMDPPASHVVANQIDKLEVIEGPYDVTSFGTLSGGVKISTKKPSKDFKGSVNLGFGSWNYKKFGATFSGGNDIIRMIATVSTESADQYHDGNGDSLAQQIDKYQAANSTTLTGSKDPRLQPAYYDMPAYTKNSAMAKAFIKTFENQELRLSVTANRSDDVLYANSKMDAIYDDSNIYSVEYNIDSISDTYKNINLQYYHSDVDHPMGTDYRMSSLNTGIVVTNWLTTNMDGIKLKNSFDINSYQLLLGLDASKRKWDGHYEKNGSAAAIGYRKSIDNAVTKNSALFAKLDKKYGSFNLSVGARVDDTIITNDSYQDNNYHSVGANILGTYHINKENKIFFGIGQAYRVPDARELYFLGSTGNEVGTHDLKDTTNQEIDLGYEANTANFQFKIKAFYSKLKDYIYYHKDADNNASTLDVHAFENIDAYIYGGEATASIYLTDDMSVDMGVSYKRGKKDKALAGQTNTNLADMAPLRGNVALNYEYANNSIATLEVRASDRWNTIDDENGEQVLAGWAILNAKVKHAVNRKFDLTVGVNNILNKTYAQSNTYADLILVTGGTTDVMLMNEPGRYIYTNLDFKF
ncbi:MULTISPECIES: TonB-dependent receptor [Sulfurimonas]|uniref:TonB-dependent receptor n=1 Tax=Sulfurimonas TaxID=202746 RepID=UPI001264793F|nr:TonB-dependent receptor [Sulfurimonas indica]